MEIDMSKSWLCVKCILWYLFRRGVLHFLQDPVLSHCKKNPPAGGFSGKHFMGNPHDEIWWRRRELNPRPRNSPGQYLQA